MFASKNESAVELRTKFCAQAASVRSDLSCAAPASLQLSTYLRRWAAQNEAHEDGAEKEDVFWGGLTSEVFVQSVCTVFLERHQEGTHDD